MIVSVMKELTCSFRVRADQAVCISSHFDFLPVYLMTAHWCVTVFMPLSMQEICQLAAVLPVSFAVCFMSFPCV